MNEPARQGDKRMTVREVAEILNVSERVVQLAVKKLYPEIVKNGVLTYLTETQVTAVKLELESHHNLEGTFEVSTRLERQLYIAKALQFANEEIQQLQSELSQKDKKIALDAPKVEFFDQVADSKDALQMRDVAAALNIPGLGRNKIFELLRKKGVLDDRNIPYREYQDRGYFRVIEQQWTDKEGETRIYLKSLVYQRGVDFIRKALHSRGPA
ncbi:MAG: phage antirepressor KilAC domain-containing protein [Treponema sp.]|jgi:phage antirepressor YoqD-like protein|nr:phage antirepressor KilAC domain-containing protein [Treponema sp.]